MPSRRMLLPGPEPDDLELSRTLHTNDHSTVFLGRHRRTRRSVVVKRIQFPPTVQDEHPHRHQELAVARRLRAVGGHPHVVDCHSAFADGSTLVLVLEHCTRGDLYALLEAQPEQRLPEAVALRLWLQIVRGVRFLHCQGIAHRDLSLENVLVDADNHIKICDFGLSAFFDRDAPHATCTGCVGKAYYMAPEVATGGDEVPYDPIRADLWSLGIILFILLTGSPLFQVAVPGDPAFRAVQAIGVRGVLTKWGLDKDLSTDTMDLLGRLLRLNPRQRLASTDEILASFACSSPENKVAPGPADVIDEAVQAAVRHSPSRCVSVSTRSG